MPSYTYRCSAGHELDRICSIAQMETFESYPHLCEVMVKKGRPCERLLQRVYRVQPPVRFREGWYEHIAPDPVYITSPQQLQDVARRHGNRSKYMQDLGGLWNVKDGREV